MSDGTSSASRWKDSRLNAEARTEVLAPNARTYGGEQLPPGAVPVRDRLLAKYAQPGVTNEPHGVPPIGLIGLPRGWVISDEFTDDEHLECLPFRFPFYSRSYALRSGDKLFAVIRNVAPFDLSGGHWVCVQLNEAFDWSAVFGRLVRVGPGSFILERPDGERWTVRHNEIHFVGKVMAWWDDGKPIEAGRSKPPQSFWDGTVPRVHLPEGGNEADGDDEPEPVDEQA